MIPPVLTDREDRNLQGGHIAPLHLERTVLSDFTDWFTRKGMILVTLGEIGDSFKYRVQLRFKLQP